MPHSLRVRLKNLNYKGLLTDRELNRLVNALDIADSIYDIWVEIKNEAVMMGNIPKPCEYNDALEKCLEIIDKHTKGDINGRTEN